jgi:hypothetical protein
MVGHIWFDGPDREPSAGSMVRQRRGWVTTDQGFARSAETQNPTFIDSVIECVLAFAVWSPINVPSKTTGL